MCAGLSLTNDWAAAAACLSGHAPPQSRSALSKGIWRAVTLLWKKEWSESSHGWVTRQFFPAPPGPGLLAARPLSHQLTQVLTGHCRLNAHMHKMGLVSSPACECGYRDETVRHFLFDCPAFDRQRGGLKVACLSAGLGWLPRLASLCDHRRVWDAMISFIAHTGRLKRASPSLPDV